MKSLKKGFDNSNKKALTITIIVVLWILIFPWIRILQIITFWVLVVFFVLLFAFYTYDLLANLFEETEEIEEEEISEKEKIKNELFIKYMKEINDRYERQSKEMDN